ncbi:cupin domain-containing protein [Paenarthrobacter sp. RAF54_2]|uniref:(R)-mandelonitrile lyase n=1 Tax=Paenarthrobacter sp. RAF54_2 TaxID=3233061 RepID=UPI003F9B0E3A
MKLINPAPTVKAPQDRFTGDVYLSPLHTGEAPSQLTAALVHFTPGARTNWHSHPVGQTLHCTEGAGLVVTRDGTVIFMRPGDTVHTPPGEEHWHGATSESMMCHLAVVERLNGESAIWLEPVDDADYQTAQSREHN